MALSFVVLIGAALLMTSALRMGSEGLGFNPDHLLTTRISLPAFRYSNESQRLLAAFHLRDRIGGLPGVAGVALATRLPPDAGGNEVLEVEGRAVEKGSEIHDVGSDTVSPEFFSVLGIPLLRGRSFTERDGVIAQPVAIINQALAREYFPQSDAIGKQIRLPDESTPWLTIVGVVGNLKHTELMNEMRWVESPGVYRPLAQNPRPSFGVAVRTSGRQGTVEREIQREVAALDPTIPASEIQPATAQVSKLLAYPRFRASVLSFFAMIALVLSAVGLYGVLSQGVVQRRREFGVRSAVGARRRDLVVLVVRQGAAPVLGGLILGLAATSGGTRLLAQVLYGVEPARLLAFAIASLILLGIAGVAIVLPALRAARVDPVTALRED